ncbi:MAG: SCO family protein [Candidatus Thiodiazotropha sp.]
MDCKTGKTKKRQGWRRALLGLALLPGVCAAWEAARFDANSQLPFKLDCVTRPAAAVSEAPQARFQVAMNDMDHAAHDHHAHHKMMMNQSGYQVKQARYSVPDVDLTSHLGDTVNLPELLAMERPVMLNFIFTTCTTICPVLSASFHQVQSLLGEDSEVAMISITIDPEYDTPERLRAYAERFRAGDEWTFYTGSYEDVVAVEKAFDIFRGSKMNHEPITLIRGQGTTEWKRIDGLASAEDIVQEYHKTMMQH